MPVSVWTSTLKRTIQTAELLPFPKLRWKVCALGCCIWQYLRASDCLMPDFCICGVSKQTGFAATLGDCLLPETFAEHVVNYTSQHMHVSPINLLGHT